MKRIGKNQQDQFQTAFSLNFKYQSTPQYPFRLATLLQKTQSQLQQSRAMKMLGDWVYEYEQMSQIIKYKYNPFVSKIQKILLGKFQQKAPIQYCVSRFFICFYSSWREFNAVLIEELNKFDSYALSFLWYTSQHLVSDMQLAKQQPFLQYLTTNYEQPLRLFDPNTYDQARKILQIVYMINVHGSQNKFVIHANNWALKMRLFQEVATDSETSVKLSMLIIRNRSMLIQQEKSKIYWVNHISLFLEYLQESIMEMNEQNILNKQILSMFQWIIGLHEVQELLLKNQSRYVTSIVNKIRPDPHNRPKFIFNNPKYQQIGQKLYELYFSNEIGHTQLRVKQILQKFTNHAFSILNDEDIYSFLQSYSSKEIILQLQIINDLLKLLSSAHIRRTLSTKVILILAKIINSSLNSCIFTDQTISLCLRAFSQSVSQKSTDFIISDLRERIAHLFLDLAKKYSWEDNNKSEIIFLLCDQYQKNSKYTSKVVLQLLSILVRKFGYGSHSLHKLEALIMQIYPKIIHDEQNMHEFISLLIVIFFSTKWDKASHLIENVCSRNPSPLAPFYSFQAHTLIKSNSSSSQAQLQIVSQILQTRQNWFDNRIKVNLILLEMYFLKLNSTQAFKILQKVDNKILDLIKQLYTQGNYRLLSQIAGKTLAAAGGPVNLQKLQSYNWIRSISFQILARSFYKSTSIYICYIFSNIILKSDNLGITLKWLCQGQFLDYLYQGLNDFLSKQKSFSLELVTTILVFKLFKYDPSLIPQESRINDFTTLAKNVGWWDQMDNKFIFSMLEGTSGEWLLPQFQIYYEEGLINYFKNYQKIYKEKRAQYLKQMESLAMDQDL